MDAQANRLLLTCMWEIVDAPREGLSSREMRATEELKGATGAFAGSALGRLRMRMAIFLW